MLTTRTTVKTGLKSTLIKAAVAATAVAAVVFGVIMIYSNFGSSEQSRASTTTIWTEDFTYADGTKSSAKFSLDESNISLGSNDYFEVRSGSLESEDIDGEGIWMSSTIDISSYSNVSISIDAWCTSTMDAGDDYLRFFYVVDGGTEIQFTTNGNLDGDFGSVVASQTGIQGNSLEIRVKFNSDRSGEHHNIDNVMVEGELISFSSSSGCAMGNVYTVDFDNDNNGTTSTSNWSSDDSDFKHLQFQ